MSPKAKVITFTYEELHRVFSSKETANKEEKKDVLDRIGQAFGGDASCLGILAVTGVPKYMELRKSLLPMARQLAQDLTESELDAITVPSSLYAAGWSHGKEKLGSGKPDFAKGSFYYNPLTDDIGESMKTRDGINPKEIPKDMTKEEYMVYFAPNVFPNESLPNLEQTAKELGNIIQKVGVLIAKACDAYVATQMQSNNKTWPQNTLSEILAKSLNCHARLLHYFAKPSISNEEKKEIEDFSTWCGWHNDHGSLTGLVPAIYIDEKGTVYDSNPEDPRAGLYIESRNGEIHHVQVPPTALAFQIGETSQIMSQGILRATPHAVASAGSSTMTREALAVFLEPEYSHPMTVLKSDASDSSIPETISERVPPLSKRWKPGMTFGQFQQATYDSFYEQTQK